MKPRWHFEPGILRPFPGDERYICDRCNNNHPLELTLDGIRDNNLEKVEVIICETCAKETEPEKWKVFIENPVYLAQYIAGKMGAKNVEPSI